MSNCSAIALIPARSGSVRIPNKNIYDLNGHPLLAYTIHAALRSGVFKRIIVVTDSSEYSEIAKNYGAETPILRPKSISNSNSPDIDWLMWAIENFGIEKDYEYIAILRPTSPLRTCEDIKKALQKLKSSPFSDSIRAVSKVTQHPGKMWRCIGDYIIPILPYENQGVPWHSSQKPTLPEIFVQNASLEVVRTRAVMNTNTISGHTVIPYFSSDVSGYDINEPEDLDILEYLIQSGRCQLPEITIRN